MTKLTPGNILEIFNPFTEFFKEQSASGFLLIAATIVAIVTANSSYGDLFIHFWETPIHLAIGTLPPIHFSLEQFVNDGLMTIFFIVVGLEIKRELIEGELSSKQKAMLPIFGALGGMIAPALIFTFLNFGKAALSGWAIPTATDIAFSLTVISLLGKRVPLSLKIFLTALAVIDDLGAIIIIALFYSQKIHYTYLVCAALVVLILALLNRQGVRNIYWYLFVGCFLWVFLHYAGIHATISGVIIAMTVPFRFKNSEEIFNEKMKELRTFSQVLESPEARKHHAGRDQVIEEMQKASNKMEAPLNNMLYLFSGFSSFVIMPLFALSNAGIKLDFSALSTLGSTMSLGIIFGLLIGKPIGITLLTFVTTKLKITSIPDGIKWRDVFCVTILAGIGFTMSIFVAKLAYTDKSMIETAKFSIIIASFLSGLIGYTVLCFSNITKNSEDNSSIK
jgi:NhaA family Na+:H+ antiporter